MSFAQIGPTNGPLAELLIAPELEGADPRQQHRGADDDQRERPEWQTLGGLDVALDAWRARHRCSTPISSSPRARDLPAFCWRSAY